MLKDFKNQKYRRMTEQLYLKCQEVQMENERYVYRIAKMKKMIKRRVRDVINLKSRLDRYNDGWRNVPMVAPHRTRKTELKRGPKPKQKSTEAKTRHTTKKQKLTEKTIKQKIQNVPAPNTSNNFS